MRQVRKTLGPTDLVREIEFRRMISAEFEALLSSLEGGGLSITTPQDLDALALLFLEVSETRKSAEKQERLLRDEIKRHFAEGVEVLDLEGVVAILTQRTRTDLDREAITRDLGTDFISKYSKRTDYEVLSVKRKGSPRE